MTKKDKSINEACHKVLELLEGSKLKPVEVIGILSICKSIVTKKAVKTED